MFVNGRQLSSPAQFAKKKSSPKINVIKHKQSCLDESHTDRPKQEPNMFTVSVYQHHDFVSISSI